MLRKITNKEIQFPPYNFNGFQYPNNMAECLSAEELAALGLEVYQDTQSVPPEDFPNSISPTQLALGLYRSTTGIIDTLDEAGDFAAAGKLPPKLLDLLNNILDKDQRETAIVRVRAATSYEFDNPITQFIGANISQPLGWTLEDLKNHWRQWALI